MKGNPTTVIPCLDESKSTNNGRVEKTKQPPETMDHVCKSSV